MQHRTPLLTLLTAGLFLVMAPFYAVSGEDPQPYPEFVAHYEAKANGIRIGSVTVSLKRKGSGRYLYKQESHSSGLAALFNPDDSVQSSLWRLHEGRIQVLEYQSKREGGDNDDNAHLVFDWENSTVKNIGAGEQWEIDVPSDAIDRLVMQLAMLFELRDGETRFTYHVPRQGRIKDYNFSLLGEDDIELMSGVYRTLKVGRTNDDKDQSWVWSAPELDYFPVRFLKEKQSGMNIELILKKLDFAPFGAATSLEVAP